MFKNIVRYTAAIAFVGLTSMPASAQIRARVDVPLPGLEIRVAHRAPPPLLRERVVYRPGPDYVWVQGFWDWQGDWVWVPGRWDRPAYRGSRWVAARYQRDGSYWRYDPGHWSHQTLYEGDSYRRWYSERSRGRDRYGDRDRYRNGYRDRSYDRDRRDR